MVLSEISSVQQIGFPILTVLLFLPLAFAVVLRFIRDPRRAYQVALTGAVIELLLACLLAFSFIPEVPTLQFVDRLGPLPLLGISYYLGVDGVNVLFVPVTALLALLVLLYRESGEAKNGREYLMAILALETTMVGIFVSLDLILFWFFFVLELVPSYFLITRFGTGPLRHRAAREYVGFMLTGSALMLVGIVLLGLNYDSERGTGLSFDYLDLTGVTVPGDLQTVIFFLLFFGFAVKAPIFPFHTWLPKVLEHGPIVGMSVFLVGIKLGTYGFLRFVIPLVPEAAREWFWLMATLGGVGIVYGALIALVQTNLRRLLAFASLSHMGAVMVGLFAFNFHGLQGGLLQMINLGIAGAGLFFVAGFLHTRFGPPELASMGGLVYSLPVLATVFLVIALGTVGLPGTGGFNGEHLILIGAYEVGWSLALVAGAGTLLTAAYLLWYFQRAFMGPSESAVQGAPGSPDKRSPDLLPRELLIALALGGLIFWIGLDSGPFLRHMDGSLRWIESRVAQGSLIAPTGAWSPSLLGGSA